jgi:hypothetical protein
MIIPARFKSGVAVQEVGKEDYGTNGKHGTDGKFLGLFPFVPSFPVVP